MPGGTGGAWCRGVLRARRSGGLQSQRGHWESQQELVQEGAAGQYRQSCCGEMRF